MMLPECEPNDYFSSILGPTGEKTYPLAIVSQDQGKIVIFDPETRSLQPQPAYQLTDKSKFFVTFFPQQYCIKKLVTIDMNRPCYYNKNFLNKAEVESLLNPHDKSMNQSKK